MSSTRPSSVAPPAPKRLKLSGDGNDTANHVAAVASSRVSNEKSLTLVSFNVAGCRPSKVAPSSWSQDDSLQAIEEEILHHERRPDIIAIQEIPLFALDRNRILSEYKLIGSQMSHAPYVALFVHQKWKAKRIHEDFMDKFDFEGLPAVMAEIDLSPNNEKETSSEKTLPQHSHLWIANVHLEPFAGGASIRKRQLQALADQARTANVPLIIAGDTNMRVAEDMVAEEELGLYDFWKLAGSDFRTKYTVSLAPSALDFLPSLALNFPLNVVVEH